MAMRSLVAALGCLLALALAGCGFGDDERAGAERPDKGLYAGAPLERDGMKLPARVQGRRLALAFEGEFADRFWPGVNLGVTVPGRHPGELPATRADYDRWLDGMQDLGARVVRVYTILRPAFYEALAAHNERNPRTPLHFIQGVWIPEEQFIAERDAYPTSEEFDREISDAVAVVHGDADLPERPGHASGRYRTDVSRWLLAWSPGVEWDPYATRNTDRVHAGAPPHRGRYIRSSADATPMESWIAARLDHLATLEAERGWSRPVTFTNWLTTDPLEHPEEPMRKEDMVSVDAAHLRATSRWPGGFFASYHAYPYYPDFLRLQPGYRDAKDPYEAYLKDLRAHHGDQAVMITEFGVPTGIGSAHYGPLGRDQGGHSEQEAGRMDADMMRAIRRQDMAGAVLFSYVDEWFKRTWNTMDMEQPEERRPLWQNALTNEEQFGILAAEPGKTAKVRVDGADEEWTREHSQQIYEGDGTVKEVRATHDAGWLYLLIRRDGDTPVQVGFDVRPGGNQGLPGRPGVVPEADVSVTLGPDREAVVHEAASTDPIGFLYGLARPYVKVDAADLEPGSGAWVRPHLMLNRPYTVPGTGEKRAAETLDVSALRWGTANPEDEDFDGRVTVARRRRRRRAAAAVGDAHVRRPVEPPRLGAEGRRQRRHAGGRPARDRRRPGGRGRGRDQRLRLGSVEPRRVPRAPQGRMAGRARRDARRRALSTLYWSAVVLPRLLIPLLLLALAVPASAGARSPFVGVNFDGLAVEPGSVSREMRRAADAGAGSVRLAFYWPHLQPYASWADVPEAQRRRFRDVRGIPTDFRETDRFVRAAARSRLHLTAVIMSSAPWAAEDPYATFSPPLDPAQYGQFARTLAERYGAAARSGASTAGYGGGPSGRGRSGTSRRGSTASGRRASRGNRSATPSPPTWRCCAPRARG